MGRYFSTEAINAMNSLSHRLSAAEVELGDELDGLFGDFADSPLAISAEPWDVDAASPADALFSQDEDTTSGLNFGFMGGQLRDGQTLVTIAAGTVALAPSTTNYVEVLYSGGSWAVSANQTAFTAGAVPLYVVTTGASAVATVTNKRVVLAAHRDSAITGKMLSTATKTHFITVDLGTLSATEAAKIIPLPNFAGKLVRATLTVETTVAASDTDYWTFAITNKGAAGAGSTAMLAATDANTTKATGGAGLVNFDQRVLTLHGTAANLDVAAEDVLIFVATKTASGANLVDAVLKLEITTEV